MKGVFYHIGVEFADSGVVQVFATSLTSSIHQPPVTISVLKSFSMPRCHCPICSVSSVSDSEIEFPLTLQIRVLRSMTVSFMVRQDWDLQDVIKRALHIAMRRNPLFWNIDSTRALLLGDEEAGPRWCERWSFDCWDQECWAVFLEKARRERAPPKWGAMLLFKHPSPE